MTAGGTGSAYDGLDAFGPSITWIRQMPSLPLLDELAGLDPRARREMVATLRTVSETFAEVPDGKTASHVVGVLARLLDPS